jgi:hypothetical protein
MKQLTVIAADRTGLIAELSGILATKQINIGTIQAQLHGNDAVIHLTVDRYEDTLHALEEENFHVVSDESVVLRMADKPGALATIAKRLADHRIDIRSLTVVQRHDGSTVVAVASSDNGAARDLLRELCMR